MSDPGNSEPPALNPAFASLLKKANTTMAPKPNFGALDQRVKLNLSLLKPKNDSAVKLSQDGTGFRSQATPMCLDNTPVAKPNCGTSSPFANLLNKNKQLKSKPSFGSSSLVKMSAKYLSNSQGFTPKFGPASSSANTAISCPTFARDKAGPADVCHDIRPLVTSKEIQIPMSNSHHRDAGNILSTSAGSSDLGSPPSAAKFTFSPIPNKTQSPCTVGTPPKNQDAKLSSLSKLKNRHVKNTKIDSTRAFEVESPSPKQGDRTSQRFNFDLSSALVTRKPIEAPVTSHKNKILTPLRQTVEHTIVVDQLPCMPDARVLLDRASSQNTVTIKRISSMGKVICRRWKAGSCENIPLRYKPPFHIPSFKFDTMSPDDEIQSKFKRRR